MRKIPRFGGQHLKRLSGGGGRREDGTPSSYSLRVPFNDVFTSPFVEGDLFSAEVEEDRIIFTHRPRRRAEIIHADAKVVEAYLPENYVVIGADEESVTIEGVDRAGWTLHDYVLPRLASGNLYGDEIEVPEARATSV